jgi:hypothetical protein
VLEIAKHRDALRNIEARELLVLEYVRGSLPEQLRVVLSDSFCRHVMSHSTVPGDVGLIWINEVRWPPHLVVLLLLQKTDVTNARRPRGRVQRQSAT